MQPARTAVRPSSTEPHLLGDDEIGGRDDGSVDRRRPRGLDSAGASQPDSNSGATLGGAALLPLFEA